MLERHREASTVERHVAYNHIEARVLKGLVNQFQIRIVLWSQTRSGSAKNRKRQSECYRNQVKDAHLIVAQHASPLWYVYCGRLKMLHT